MKYFKLLLISLIALLATQAVAQRDSTSFKNTIHFNITNPLLFGGKSLIMGYERVLKHNQTFTVNLGTASYPKVRLINRDSIDIGLDKDYKEKGFHLSFDYRFYPMSENKYPAPRGVYFGPYYSYNYFNRVNNWTMNTSTFQGSVESDLTFNIHSMGLELGYQFVFWDRLSVDLVLIGPGVSFYKINCELSSGMSPEDQQHFYDELNQFLTETFPGINRVITGEGFEKTGSIKTASLGYRYFVTVGFRF